MDVARKKRDKFRLMNEERRLDSLILNSQSVAKLLLKLNVKNKNSILKYTGGPKRLKTEVGDTFVDRMSRRLTSVKQYLSRKDQMEKEMRKSIMRESISNMIRMSITQAK